MPFTVSLTFLLASDGNSHDARAMRKSRSKNQGTNLREEFFNSLKDPTHSFRKREERPEESA
jgi:hypothetical protein